MENAVQQCMQVFRFSMGFSERFSKGFSEGFSKGFSERFSK